MHYVPHFPGFIVKKLMYEYMDFFSLQLCLSGIYPRISGNISTYMKILNFHFTSNFISLLFLHFRNDCYNFKTMRTTYILPHKLDNYYLIESIYAIVSYTRGNLRWKKL